MSDPILCEHKWQHDVLWAVVGKEVPRADSKDLRYQALERCINCGLIRVPEDWRGKRDFPF
jgi:hypothetical protein